MVLLFGPRLVANENLRDLSLGSNRMNGTLIPEIFALNLDIRLDLSYNDFTGPIPTEVGNMVNLTSFTVNGNAGINGELPEEMSGMTQLAEIRINDTDMTGPIPDSVCTAFNGSDPSPNWLCRLRRPRQWCAMLSMVLHQFRLYLSLFGRFTEML